MPMVIIGTSEDSSLQQDIQLREHMPWVSNQLGLAQAGNMAVKSNCQGTDVGCFVPSPDGLVLDERVLFLLLVEGTGSLELFF